MLRKVSARPPAEKVRIGPLAREFGVGQAMICDMIAWLVRQGRLDAATLREAKPRKYSGGGFAHDAVPTGQILPEIKAFLAKSGMTPTLFGRRCMRDPSFVLEMISGERSRVRATTAEKVRAYIAEWKPELAEEPDVGLAAQLERLAKGGKLIPAFTPRKALPDGTLGGVVGEIN